MNALSFRSRRYVKWVQMLAVGLNGEPRYMLIDGTVTSDEAQINGVTNTGKILFKSPKYLDIISYDLYFVL